MQNTTRVKLFQMIPETGRRFLSRALRQGNLEPSASIHGIDHFPTPKAKIKRALVALSPDAWLRAREQYPNIRYFNYIGLTYQIVKVLNENSYLVDIVDHSKEHSPRMKYDLFVGHGGHCRTIIDSLPPRTPILQYVSGAHWAAFNSQSAARYRRFSQVHGYPFTGQFTRSMAGITEGEEYLSQKATHMFTIECPRMAAAYGDLASKFVFTGLGAYEDAALGHPAAKQHNHPTRFLYLAGTGGNIQKGLDLFIDAFSSMPTYHLYIYCKVESEIINYASRQFNASNIHYIYHWRHAPFQSQLRDLMNTISFTIHAGINSGLGTAFSASLAAGMIPVGYVDYSGNSDHCILSDSWDVDALSNCIKGAANSSRAWRKVASDASRQFYEANCTASGFATRFQRLVNSLT